MQVASKPEIEKEEEEEEEDMGGKKSSFCGLCCFGMPRNGEDEVDWEQRPYTRKMRPSDEDRGRWVGERDVDEKASAFIARFYASRYTDSERQAMMV
ncbi:hypothetical protein Cni_G00751 [Canna indica]|uniref:Uncharacterized protein n=1 Tax=Canna indica TaxID=4628 RepID=A0AAQ3JNG4_9LILI|nr:hypothetical protein Cni_G00751 [Canna indica]